MMKTFAKITFALLLGAIPFMGAGQSAADKLFDKYSGREGYTSVLITQHMFSLFADVETGEEEQGFLDLVKTLESIKIISAENDSGKVSSGINFYDEVMKDLPEKEYEELMVVRKKDQNTKFLIRKDGKIIRELLMISGGDHDNALISIKGDINLKTISKISK